MIFKSLSLAGWRQYRSVHLDLHDRLTILTGANGAGKTTILNLLSRHFGWQGQLVSTPRRRKSDTGAFRYLPDFWRYEFLEPIERLLSIGSFFDPIETEPPEGPEREIGQIVYDNGATGKLTVPVSVGQTYQVNIHHQHKVSGLHIPSHRPLYGYQPVQQIPVNPKSKKELYSQYIEIVRNRYYGQHHQRTPNYFIKETLVSLATFGYGNAVVEPNPDALALFEEFQRVLALVLPPKLGFERIAIRMPEVVLVTASGEFSLDAVSGGVASIIDIAWQLFMYGSEGDRYVVTIDERENHLHPELQRTVLSSLLSAFPQVQFIVATHNPFIVSSVPESHVYVLAYDASQRVYTEFLDTVNRAGSSNEILRDVLGLEFTIPRWVEVELQGVLDRFSASPLTEENLDVLRRELKKLGLEKFAPSTIARLADRRGDG